MNKLTELIERWQNLTRSDRSLDADTALATGWEHRADRSKYSVIMPLWYKNGKPYPHIVRSLHLEYDKAILPPFTGSLDATKLLIPEGFGYEIKAPSSNVALERLTGNLPIAARVFNLDENIDIVVAHNSDIFALGIAALKACDAKIKAFVES